MELSTSDKDIYREITISRLTPQQAEKIWEFLHSEKFLGDKF